MDYSTLSAEELALTCFRSGNETAWSEFVRRFHPLIARVVLRVARQWGETPTQVVDDLIQDTYLKLCVDRQRFLESFAPARPDAIYGYIKVFTANLVHDHFKASRSEKRGGSAVSTSIDDEYVGSKASGSKATEALMERNVLIQEIDACLKVISSGPSSARDRTIFWLYYRVGLAASAIAAVPSIELTTKGVESTLLRLTRQIRERLGDRGQVSARKRSEGIQSAESL